MSASSMTLPTSDLRSTAQDYKRDATHKHKWALGASPRVGRPEGNVRPSRPKETPHTYNRNELNRAVRYSNGRVHKHALTNERALSGNPANIHNEEDIFYYSSSPPSDSDSATVAGTASFPRPSALPSPDAGVMYSFDSPRGPTHGSGILDGALRVAVARFEEKETVKLVRKEYDVVGVDGEVVEVSGGVGKRGRGKGKAAMVPVEVGVDEEEYEFV